MSKYYPPVASDYSHCQLDTLAQYLQLPPDYGSMYIACQYARIADEDFIIGYNFMYNQLEFWNLNQVKPIKRTRLTKEGPGSISEVGSFYYHHADTIFMISQYALNITNANGQSSFSTRINQSNTALRGIDFDALQIYPDLMHSAPVYYNAAEKALYVPIKPFGSEFNKSYCTNPICARILLPDYEVELLPIYYPEAYQSKWFGMMDKPNITFWAKKLYLILNSARIFMFMIKT